MPIDNHLLLYALANTFKVTLGTKTCDATSNMLKKQNEIFNSIKVSEKLYYSKYAMQIAQNLIAYLGQIDLFELNVLDEDEEDKSDINHDFRLHYDDNVTHICMFHNNICIRNIIPEKLMKICKYKRNTNVNKYYTSKYDKIMKHGYKKISKFRKYSNIPENKKSQVLYKPLCDLIITTLSKKRKCSQNLFNYLFTETDRIVLKLYKNRFVIYDFGIDVGTADSFKMKMLTNSTISIIFNNGAKIILSLQTNGSQIKQHMSLKFHCNFQNIDELFGIVCDNIKI